MTNQIHDIPSFLERAVDVIGRAASNVRLQETRSTRVLRRFSVAEVAEILGCNRSSLHALLKHPDAPRGEARGRENTLSVQDIMRLRALAAARPASRLQALHWRRPGDTLPVIVASCQKGGTAKTTVSAHLAQYMSLYLGLRVGVCDADPQATCSLYFADDETSLHAMEPRTYTEFMGVPEPGETETLNHDAAALDAFWRPTPWPGLRLIPGGASIQEADIAMYYLTRTKNREQKKVYRMLRDAIGRWEKAYPPRTVAEDFMGADGRFCDDVFNRALTETLDVIIIDTPPSLTLAALNAVVAADTLIVPQTMRGFDLATLHTYLSSLNDYFTHVIAKDNRPIHFAQARPFIMPTIVNRNNDSDIRTIGEIFRLDPDVICPVFYRYSEGAANAFRDYKSIYEYQPDKARRASVQAFLQNANAVNDAILTRAIPSLPSRGFARAFIEEHYPGSSMPGWTGQAVARLGPEDDGMFGHGAAA